MKFSLGIFVDNLFRFVAFRELRRGNAERLDLHASTLLRHGGLNSQLKSGLSIASKWGLKPLVMHRIFCSTVDPFGNRFDLREIHHAMGSN